MVDAEVTVIDETEGGGTANVDTKSLVGVGGKTVHRQIVSIGDPDTFGQEAAVNATGELLVKHTDSIAITSATLATEAELATKLDEATFTGRINTQGQKTMAGSTPVVLASDHSTIPVEQQTPVTVEQTTASSLKAEVIGLSSDNSANTTTKQAVISARGNAADPIWTEGNQVPLSVDLSGRQRTAIGLWFGSTAPTVGSKTSANSIPVVIASDQGNVPVSQATASNLNAQVVGSIAHDTGDAGNPVKIGGNARQTNPTAVADADRVNAIFDDIGRQVVVMDQVRDLVNDQTTTITASTTETTIFTAVASVFNDLVMLTVANTSATATRIDFRDTTAGSVRFSLYCPAGATIGFVPKVPIKQATVNTNWTAQCGTSVTDIRIFAQVVRNV